MATKAEWTKLAQERINILFRQAVRTAIESRLDRSSRYVFLARKLGMKYGVRLNREQRRKFCHKCYKYLQPGQNVDVKINPKSQSVEYICKNCGHVNRYPYIKEKKAR